LIEWNNNINIIRLVTRPFGRVDLISWLSIADAEVVVVTRCGSDPIALMVMKEIQMPSYY